MRSSPVFFKVQFGRSLDSYCIQYYIRNEAVTLVFGTYRVRKYFTLIHITHDVYIIYMYKACGIYTHDYTRLKMVYKVCLLFYGRVMRFVLIHRKIVSTLSKSRIKFSYSYFMFKFFIKKLLTNIFLSIPAVSC